MYSLVNKPLKGSKYFKESNHRYKQKIEKAYILKQMIVKQQETKVKQNEKVQEVHWGVGNCIWYWNDASQPDANYDFQGQVKVQSQSQT